MTVRANTLIGDRDALAKALAAEKLETRAGRWSDTALIVETRTNLFATAAFTARRVRSARRGQPAARRARDAGRREADRRSTTAPAPAARRSRSPRGSRIAAASSRPMSTTRSSKSCAAAPAARRCRTRARCASTTASSTRCTSKADLVFVDAPCTGIGSAAAQPRGALAPARGRARRVRGAPARHRDVREAAPAPQVGRWSTRRARVLARRERGRRRGDHRGTRGSRTVPLAERFGAARADALGDRGALAVAPDRHGTDGFFAQVFRRT